MFLEFCSWHKSAYILFFPAKIALSWFYNSIKCLVYLSDVINLSHCYSGADILSYQARERLGDPLQGPSQTQQDTVWQIVNNEHTPQSTTFDVSKSDISQQLTAGKHGKTTKLVDISVSAKSRFFTSILILRNQSTICCFFVIFSTAANFKYYKRATFCDLMN